jgi:hypothetical protein
MGSNDTITDGNLPEGFGPDYYWKQLDHPSDPQEIAYVLHTARRRAGLSLVEISEQLQTRYGVELSSSAVSHAINRGTSSLRLALQLMTICGVDQVRISKREA